MNEKFVQDSDDDNLDSPETSPKRSVCGLSTSSDGEPSGATSNEVMCS